MGDKDWGHYGEGSKELALPVTLWPYFSSLKELGERGGLGVWDPGVDCLRPG